MVSMLFVVILVRVLSMGSPGVKELNSQQFLAAVHTHEFVTNPSNSDNQVTVHNGDDAVTGELKDGKKFVYYYPQNYNVAALLNKAGIPFITIPQNNGFWFTLIGTLAPILLIVLFFILFMSSMQGGGNRVMSFGKSRAEQMSKFAPKVTFSDVAGAEEAVQEL